LARDWSGTVAHLGSKDAPEILPRWLRGRRGASVVRRDAAINRRISNVKGCEEIIICFDSSPRCHEPSRSAYDLTTSRSTNPGSKQSRVIAMLQSPQGATIAAMMKATDWQQHSVRGFLAGVVRKRLKLKLSSKKVDGNRVYQIAGGDGGKSVPRQSKRRPS
jgi:Protein of unknown function (DUF3489)